MPYTTAAKNLMLDALARGVAPASSAAFLGLLSADAGISITITGGSGTVNATAHGYSAGDVVLLSALTGGSGYVQGRVYFVVNPTANTFQLALTPGGAPITGGTDATTGTSTRLVELTGGSPAYGRVSTGFAAASGGVSDDPNSHAVNVPGGVTVSYVGTWTAATAGTLFSVAAVTPESFAGQGVYTVTDSKFDLLAGA